MGVTTPIALGLLSGGDIGGDGGTALELSEVSAAASASLKVAADGCGVASASLKAGGVELLADAVVGEGA